VAVHDSFLRRTSLAVWQAKVTPSYASACGLPLGSLIALCDSGNVKEETILLPAF